MNMASQHKIVTLWVLAYDKLSDDDKNTLNQYAAQLADLNTILINKRLREKELRQWSVKLAGKTLKVREIGQKIMGFIDTAKDFIQMAASQEPHAAIAWTCISLLLPLITNHSDQTEAMLTGLDRISYLIGFYHTWEGLYRDSDATTANLREAVVKLYLLILGYQARLLRYLSKNPIKRVARNLAGQDEWEKQLTEVNTHDERCMGLFNLDEIRVKREQWEEQYKKLEEQSDVSKQILQQLIEIRQAKLKALSDQQRDKRIELVRSLSSDYKRQKDSNPDRVPGTCRWFVDDQRFKAWRDCKEDRLLRVFAGPGCGKSVLAKYLVDSGLLTASDDTSVLYFFYKVGLDGQQRCENALAAMLHQLYARDEQEGMMVHAAKSFEVHGNRLPTMFDDLWEILLRTVEDPAAGEIVCVIDALDECLEDDRRRLIDKISQYFTNAPNRQQSGGRLKLLITSRPWEDIKMEFDELAETSSFISLDGTGDKADMIAEEISLVIEAKVPQYLGRRTPPKVQRALIKALKEKQNRTYLWLHLILDFIKRNVSGYGTEKGIKKLVEILPANVKEAYVQMLQKSSNLLLAKNLLHLVVAARRPLMITEAKYALVMTETSESCFSDLEEDVETDEQFEDSLAGICGLILSVHDSRVFFIHQTARDFILKETFDLHSELSSWAGPVKASAAEALMTEVCVSFLHLDGLTLSSPPVSEPFNWQEFRQSSAEVVDGFRFLSYAADHWFDHAGQADTKDSPTFSREKALCADLELAKIWYPLCGLDKGMWSSAVTPPGLVIVAKLGISHLIQALIEENKQASTASETFNLALSEALREEHFEIAQLLLNNGADVNSSDISRIDLIHENPLHEASRIGNFDTIRFLVENGVDVNILDMEDQSALHKASKIGNLDIARLLVENGANVNLLDKYHRSALQEASMTGELNMVRFLLENGANVNSLDNQHWSALHEASSVGNLDIVQLLVENGANVNSLDEGYWSALHQASAMGNLDIVRFLLENGANINSLDETHRSALYVASGARNLDIVQFLVENGANMDLLNVRHQSALHEASSTGSLHIVRYLVENGADVNLLDEDHRSALHGASWTMNLDMVRFLVENGADTGELDIHVYSALGLIPRRRASI